MTKQEIIKELRRVRKYFKIVYETNLIPERDRAINYAYHKIKKIIVMQHLIHELRGGQVVRKGRFRKNTKNTN